MKSLEEKANNELGKRLREKFENYKAPVKDEVRDHVFAALDKTSNRIYWIPVLIGLLLISGFFIGNLVKNQTKTDKKVMSVSGKDKAGNIRNTKAKPDFKTEKNTVINNAKKQTNKDIVLKKSIHQFENKLFNTKQPIAEFSKNNLAEYTSSTIPDSALTLADIAFLSAIDSVHITGSLKPSAIPSVSPNATKETIKKQGILNGVKGVFSASVLQTFQLVNLSQSAADQVQNFQFAPLLSSKSLSYKLTAGVEKKNTQLLLSYTYLRNWNEYEIGTNQVIVTRLGAHQYQMTRIGEKHLEDERSHLLGIGIRQRFMMPQNVLKNYSINAGMEYTRLIPQRQDLVWGNIGFYKHIYQAGGTRFEIGPYFQYSFTQREAAGEIWKSRPYQVGVSFHVRMK